MNQLLKVLPLILLCCVFFQANAQTLVIPPDPGPGLSTVEHLKKSDDYIVEVKKATDASYSPCFVYETDNYASNLSGGERRPQKSASFTNVSFSGGAVDVRITTNFTASSVKVKPLNYNITANRVGNVITFRLDSPKKLAVEVNDRTNPLFLFFDEPDVPNTAATYYYGPGVHNVGIKNIVIKSNESVYIAGGAIVEGTFVVANNATNINFRGRGIISNGELPTLAEQGGTSNATLFQNTTISSPTLYSSSCNNVSFEGFIIVNGAAWTFALPNYNHTNHHNSWRNIKEVQWTGCTDGIWFDGDNNTIDDCFIFNNDDLVTTHGSNNCTVTNTTMWGGSWGGHLFYHDDYVSSNGITFDNINFLGSDGCKEVIWVMSRSGSATTVENVTFRNVRIEEHLKRNSYMTAKLIFFELDKNKVKNWLFENFTVDDQNADEGHLYGTPEGATVDQITFRNLKMAGNCIGSLAEAHMDINAYTTNVKFEASPEINIQQGLNPIVDNTGSYGFGNVAVGASSTITFTLENKGCGALNVSGAPKVTVTGTGFSLVTDVASTIASGTTTTFQVKFQPAATGALTGTVSILSNDADESPYNFSITGTGTGGKINQTITFSPIPAKTICSADFAPGATASSGLAVSYASSNTAVATIVAGKIHIVGAGTSNITASQAGDATYNGATNVTVPLTVNGGITPAVSITASSTNICSGNNVTFNATATNGGTTPIYQWKKNGANIGTNASTYSSTTLANNDVITCVLTSNATCASPTTATSTGITMIVNPVLIPSVSITASATDVCAGANITFTATPANGGTTPSYQWNVNGNNAGTNSTTFSSSTLANNDVIRCTITSNATCVSPTTATSNSISVKINATSVPMVSVGASSSSICSGVTNVTFKATPTNGGTSPSYQWKLNSTNVGTNSTAYSNASLVDNDQISVVMTSNLACKTTPTATSNIITMSVSASVVPSVSISVDDASACAGTLVTFTADANNGGTSPIYQWKRNGNNVGTNDDTYTSNALANGDVITCALTSNLSCASPASATSPGITMNIIPSVTPSVTIAESDNDICAGTSVTFTASPINGGASPSYQWKKNGLTVGSNQNSYSDNALANNDQIRVEIISTAGCASTPTAVSNNVIMKVQPILEPDISIAASITTVCSKTTVTFAAAPINEGANPAYQWKLNGGNVGTNSITYLNMTLVDSDVVTCVLTSSAPCASPTTAVSNDISINVSELGDDTPPSIPVDLTSTSRTSTTIALRWAAATDDVGVVGYDIYEGTTLVGTSTTNSFVVTGLLEGTSYNFSVKAHDCSGNFSANSETLTINTFFATDDFEAPSIPTGLTSPAQTSTTIALTWTASTDNVSVVEYEIYINDVLIGNSPINSFTVSGLDPSTSYTFTIKAKDGAGNVSALSNAITIETTTSETTYGNIRPRKIFSTSKDQFWLISGIEVCTSCSVVIFTRTGTKIFETNDYLLSQWDGSFKGKKLMDGGYSYVIKERSKVIKTGTITIIP